MPRQHREDIINIRAQQAGVKWCAQSMSAEVVVTDYRRALSGGTPNSRARGRGHQSALCGLAGRPRPLPLMHGQHQRGLGCRSRRQLAKAGRLDDVAVVEQEIYR